ncbi:hypothetical protein LP420_28380 [Massilia sp. B-10]|nr:hypothetical protein LP420_28380 [Massilia sp. B-10]
MPIPRMAAAAWCKHVAHFSYVLTPVLIASLIGIAKLVALPYLGNVKLLRVALPLVGSVAVIRMVFYLLRRAFARRGPARRGPGHVRKNHFPDCLAGAGALSDRHVGRRSGLSRHHQAAVGQTRRHRLVGDLAGRRIGGGHADARAVGLAPRSKSA